METQEIEISSKNQEEISICYFNAVAAKANAIPAINRRDEDGIDATISKYLKVDDIDFDSKINFQLKSVYSKTSFGYDKNGDIYYDLKVGNYNTLVRKCAIRRYLILLILPENKNEWVVEKQDSLSIKQCMYFLSLKNKEPSTNINTVRVYIPKENIFNRDNLLMLLEKAAEEDDEDGN